MGAAGDGDGFDDGVEGGVDAAGGFGGVPARQVFDGGEGVEVLTGGEAAGVFLLGLLEQVLGAVEAGLDAGEAGIGREVLPNGLDVVEVFIGAGDFERIVDFEPQFFREFMHAFSFGQFGLVVPPG